MSEAQIILSHSRESGIVAIASGEQYPWAHTALAESGFQRDDDGVWHLPSHGTRTTVVELVTCANRLRASVHTSSLRFIGDAARDLARLLPGQWHASVEIYSHPAWQEDLIPWTWDSGELGRAVQSERVPYATLLTEAMQGTTLLFIERPGRQLDYLVGAFSPEGLHGGYGDPHAPRSIVLPPFPGRAAQALTDRYLPAYEQAVHARQTAAIAAVLGDIRSEHDTWQAMNASGRYSEATPLSASALGASTELFLDHAWRRFLTVVGHAPTLLDRCRPANSPWPDDAAALSRLAAAVIDAEALVDEIVRGGSVPEQERRARAWPAIEMWLTDGEAFLRQARLSAPHRRPAFPVAAPARPPRRGPVGVPQPLTVPSRQRLETPAPLQPGIHFSFGDHKEHGFVASFTSSIPRHLAHWFLEREQFEPVPGDPGLYRLSEPERDGVRRTRQAVHDLRRHGYTVQADIRLNPALSTGPPRPVQPNELLERRSRLAQAAAGRTTQRSTPPTTSPPSARPIPPKPTYVPTVHLTSAAGGRSR